MPIQSVAGKPYPRAIDPVPAPVLPNGTQPISVYHAPLAFIPQGIREFDVVLPNADDLYLEFLFFGCDYPIKVSGVQQYDMVYDSVGNPLPIEGLSFAVSGGLPFGGALANVPSVVVNPGDPIRYQQILRGETVTNGVPVQGFPYYVATARHNLYASESGNAGDFAPFVLSLDVTLNSGTNIGPGSFINFSFFGPPTDGRAPIILWEGNMTQAIADAGYQIDDAIFGAVPCPVKVVGLWSSPFYSPIPGGLLEGKAAAPLAADSDAAPAPVPFVPPFDAFRKRLSSK